MAKAAIPNPRVPPAKPTKVSAEALPIGRRSERVVRRYMAQCPFEACVFNERDSMRRHSTKDAAVVETVRHLRASDHLVPREVEVKRIALVRREVLSEEVV